MNIFLCIIAMVALFAIVEVLDNDYNEILTVIITVCGLIVFVVCLVEYSLNLYANIVN